MEGKVYCCCVLDCYSRRVVGWAIADHVRAELVVDALELAKWNRSPTPGMIVYSDRGGQYVSWLFGHRVRAAGLLGRHDWQTRDQFAPAISGWIEGFYNPTRRHTSIGSLSPAAYEDRHTPTEEAA